MSKKTMMHTIRTVADTTAVPKGKAGTTMKR